MKNKHRSLLVGSLLLVLTAASGRAALVEEFLLNEGATNPAATIVASTASTNTGTLSGTTLPAWETTNLPPIPGGATAYLFFGSTASVGSYIQTTSSAVTGTNARTVAFWLMAPNAPQPGLAGICSWGANSAGQRFTLRLDPGTSGGVLGAIRLEDQGAFATGKTPLTDGKWHHIAVVYPGGPPTNSIFYIDGNVEGQSAGSSNVVNTTVTATATTKLAIGTVPTVGANTFGLNGSLADFRIYNTPLTQSNILQLVFGSGTPPAISGGLSNQVAVLGDTNATVTFTVNATGSSPSYFWLHDGTNFSAPNSASLVLGPQLTDANLGSYSVIVSNAFGNVTSAPVTLSWTTTPVDPSHQAAVVGGSASFAVKNLPSYQTYSYQWQEAGLAISGATGSSYTRSNLTAPDTTNFTVVLTLGADKATSAPVQLVVVSTSDPYASIVLKDNPMAYWRLDEANGATVAVDQSTFDNGRYVNYQGSELGATGALVNDSDTASTFDLSAESNYIEVPFDPALARTNSFTLEAWVNPTSASGTIYQSIIGSHTKNATAGAELGVNGVRWDFRTGDSTDSSTQTFDDLVGGTVTNNTWTHVVATFDGSVKRLYVNGLLLGSETTNLLASSVLWRIGADQTYQTSAGQFFTGSIDEVAIYGNALSSGQVVNHYDMGAYGTGVAPVILVQPQTQTLGSGASNITFTVVAGGTPPFTYQWFFNSTNLSGATGNSLTITNAGLPNLGSYTVSVGNSVNSTTSAPAQLTIAVFPSDVAALTGGSATLGVSLATNAGYTFQWKFNGGKHFRRDGANALAVFPHHEPGWQLHLIGDTGRHHRYQRASDS